MFIVFLVIQVLITIAMVGFILMQRSDADGLGGMGGGANASSFMSQRGTANFMTRSTAILAGLFMLNSLWLGILAGNMGEKRSIADQVTHSEETPKAAEEPVTTVPVAEEPATERPQAEKPQAEKSQAEAPKAPASTPAQAPVSAPVPTPAPAPQVPAAPVAAPATPSPAN